MSQSTKAAEGDSGDNVVSLDDTRPQPEDATKPEIIVPQSNTKEDLSVEPSAEITVDELEAMANAAARKLRVGQRGTIEAWLDGASILDHVGTAAFTAWTMDTVRTTGPKKHPAAKVAEKMGCVSDNRRQYGARFLSFLRSDGAKMAYLNATHEGDNEALITSILEHNGVDACADAYNKWVQTSGKEGDYGYTPTPRPPTIKKPKVITDEYLDSVAAMTPEKRARVWVNLEPDARIGVNEKIAQNAAKAAEDALAAEAEKKRLADALAEKAKAEWAEAARLQQEAADAKERASYERDEAERAALEQQAKEKAQASEVASDAATALDERAGIAKDEAEEAAEEVNAADEAAQEAEDQAQRYAEEVAETTRLAEMPTDEYCDEMLASLADTRVPIGGYAEDSDFVAIAVIRKKKGETTAYMYPILEANESFDYSVREAITDTRAYYGSDDD